MIATLTSWLLSHLLTYVIGLLSGVWANYQLTQRIKKQAEQKAGEDAKAAGAITNASSSDDVSHAIDSISKHM